ncbi:hypothetical protein ACQ4N7_28490 [Nodosilinea sp. AN01ver1]|uniref:hypothetical protein n=1 Tax=Nodosilinea sp. AN01ver1 TaxID=3423362 RepID=UPI003D31EE99
MHEKLFAWYQSLPSFVQSLMQTPGSFGISSHWDIAAGRAVIVVPSIEAANWLLAIQPELKGAQVAVLIPDYAAAQAALKAARG